MRRPSTILIVDDSAAGREALRGVLTGFGYELIMAENGVQALEQAAATAPDLILLDVMMPEMDGYEVCRRLRQDERLAEVPVIMITALDDRDARVQGLEAGADDFISKPFDRSELRARVKTVTELNRYRRLLGERAKVEQLVSLAPDGIVVVDGSGVIQFANPAARMMLGGDTDVRLEGGSLWNYVSPDHLKHCRECFGGVMVAGSSPVRVETTFVGANGASFPVEVAAGSCIWDDQPSAELIIRDITDRKQAEREILDLNSELLLSYDATLEGWVLALDLRDHETEGHTQRVTEMTVRFARASGMEDGTVEQMRRGALLHDIGKIGVPDDVLHKPGPLTEEEWVTMRKHPTLARDMLKQIAFLQPALDIPYCHHEKWDGSGYPRSLAGDEIPLAARMFALVDVWDALTSDRPYRKAWSQEKVRDHIRQGAGTHFDPELVEPFLEVL